MFFFLHTFMNVAGQLFWLSRVGDKDLHELNTSMRALWHWRERGQYQQGGGVMSCSNKFNNSSLYLFLSKTFEQRKKNTAPFENGITCSNENTVIENIPWQWWCCQTWKPWSARSLNKLSRRLAGREESFPGERTRQTAQWLVKEWSWCGEACQKGEALSRQRK